MVAGAAGRLVFAHAIGSVAAGPLQVPLSEQSVSFVCGGR
jgi:hypothetical protein